MNHDNDDNDTAAFDESDAQPERELLETIKRIGDPPCKDCPLRRRCAAEPAACADYHLWIETGALRNVSRHPTRDLYDYTESLAPYDTLGADQYARSQVLNALLVEAETENGRGRAFRWPKGLRDDEGAGIKGYRDWLRFHGAAVGPKALRLLLNRWLSPALSLCEVVNALREPA